MRVGILSDSHLPSYVRQLDELGPDAVKFFSSVDLILHGGDITAPFVLDWLEQFAPVVCSTGNNDPIPDLRCEDVQVLDLEGWRIGMVHDLGLTSRPMTELQKIFSTPVDIMLAGHTHQEALLYREGVVILNSGSVTFPQHKDLRLGTVGLLDLSPDKIEANIILLGHTPGYPNPGQEMGLQVYNGDVTANGGAIVSLNGT